MTDPRFKMSDETAAYYKAPLDLMGKDLFRTDGYSEIYILNSKDLLSIPNPEKNDRPNTGLAFFDKGEGINILRDFSKQQEYYNYLKGEILGRAAALQDADKGDTDPDKRRERLMSASSPASIALTIPGEAGEKPRHVGIIFLSDDVVPLVLAGDLGLSKQAYNQVNKKDDANSDDFKKFIVLPHEAGHLSDNLKNGRMIDTSLPMDLAVKKMSSERHAAEIGADEYARQVFDEATIKGLTHNPLQGETAHSAQQTTFHYRTLASVDNGLIAPGIIADHSTSPFMKGAPFHEGDPSSYKTAVAAIKNGVDVSTARLMGEYTKGEHENNQSFWSSSIRSCFSRAVDFSYAGQKQLGKLIETLDGNPPDTLPKLKGGISEAFSICMTGDFSNRYELLRQQYERTPNETPKGQLLGMYIEAAEAEIPKNELHPMQQQRPPSAPGM